jgi:hypothetical protein
MTEPGTMPISRSKPGKRYMFKANLPDRSSLPQRFGTVFFSPILAKYSTGSAHEFPEFPGISE